MPACSRRRTRRKCYIHEIYGNHIEFDIGRGYLYGMYRLRTGNKIK